MKASFVSTLRAHIQIEKTADKTVPVVTEIGPTRDNNDVQKTIPRFTHSTRKRSVFQVQYYQQKSDYEEISGENDSKSDYAEISHRSAEIQSPKSKNL